MRLWHEKLLPYLPRQQLLGQHRECCALRGLGWGRPHATVNYVFNHPYGFLVEYHYLVLYEMEARGYRYETQWLMFPYRGKRCEYGTPDDFGTSMIACIEAADRHFVQHETIYPEHNEEYLQECLLNLADKGIQIEMEDDKD